MLNHDPGQNDNSGAFLPRAACAAVALAMSLGVGMGFAHALDPKIYASPEEAAAGLIEALGSDDREALLQVLGDQYKDELSSEDEAAEREGRRIALTAAKEVLQLREDSDDVRVMVVGKQAWPVPFPIIRAGGGWQFDTGAGLDELLARRVGRGELAAIATLQAYVDAQMDYASADRDGDEVLEYAQKIASATGRQDGLYWPVAEGSEEPLSPFGPLVAEKAAYLDGREAGDPFMGYYFRVLTRQGEPAPGGRYDYVINGNMIAGFAMLAYPAEYGETGIMSFVVSHQGKIFERDLGDRTEILAAAIQEYAPNDTWALVGK